MPYIERVQVEAEGFLAGLDVTFSPGLNVIIGARGTGKTSIIELVRFGLGAGAFTHDAAERGEQQARAILDGGAVTVTVRDGDTRLVSKRTASMSAPQLDTASIACTVLAQNEVEAVGAQKTGRLLLIDRFRPARGAFDAEILDIEGRLRSLTREIVDTLVDVEVLSEASQEEQELSSKLSAARETQLALLQSSAATQPDQDRLNTLQAALQAIAARSELIDDAASHSESTRRIIQEAIDSATSWTHDWPSGAAQDVFGDVRLAHQSLLSGLGAALLQAGDWSSKVEVQRAANEQRAERVGTEIRELRQSLDLIKAGASQAAQRVAELEQQAGRASATRSRLQQRDAQLQELKAQRNKLYAQLEAIHQAVFEQRLAVVETLNQTLGPSIRVKITKSTGTEEYRGAIINAIRGTGLHYNTLGPRIASKVAPIELVNWVESGDVEAFASSAEISPERAAVILRALRDGIPEIVVSRVPDEVELQLLDGQDYKSTDRLSIGQRCTVVLPLLLGHEGDPLLLDQPEDHLDNAFVAYTLVAALLQRTPNDQYIFASHNANIPVLGAADNVVVMGSDGDRGFVVHSGLLDDPMIVDSIERLMEGGVEAFQRRSEFYAAHLD